MLEGFYSWSRYNPARSIFWLSCSWGSPDVNITHATLHFTSSVVRVLPAAPTYHLCEAWWQSLWWGWGVLGLLLRCSVAWQRKAQHQQSPSYVVDTYLYMTKTLWTQGQTATRWRKKRQTEWLRSIFTLPLLLHLSDSFSIWFAGEDFTYKTYDDPQCCL